MLLTTGGLLLQTFRHLQQLDLGIRSERLLTFVTPLFRYRDFDRRVAFVDAQLEKIRALPGVVSADAISRIPLTVNDQATFYRLAGQPDTASRDQVALSRVVTRGYFSTVGATLREGRFFDMSGSAFASARWRSSMNPSPIGISLDDRRSASASSSDASARRATGTPSSEW